MNKREIDEIKIVDLIPVVVTDDIRKGIEDRKKLAKKIEEETNSLVKTDVISIEKGTASIEGNYDEAVNAPNILQKVEWAGQQGYNALVIDCFGDPSLDAAREISNIPIIGANQSAIHLASQLAGRFSVINILPEMEYLTRSLITKYGLIQNLASIRTIQVPVLELEKDSGFTLKKIVEAAQKAVLEDSAYAIVLGCTGMSSLVKAIEQRFMELNIDVPVIEPLRAAIYTAISVVLMGVSHSKKAYMRPREKYKNISLG
jgi:allantoin racemase